MNETQFHAQVRSRSEMVVIDLSGDMNAAAQPAMESACEMALRAQPRRVLLNLSQVGYINSTGIAIIVTLLSRLRGAGVPLAAFGVSDHYREIFQITRLSDFIPLYPDEAAAAAAPRVGA